MIVLLLALRAVTVSGGSSPALFVKQYEMLAWSHKLRLRGYRYAICRYQKRFHSLILALCRALTATAHSVSKRQSDTYLSVLASKHNREGCKKDPVEGLGSHHVLQILLLQVGPQREAVLVLVAVAMAPLVVTVLMQARAVPGSASVALLALPAAAVAEDERAQAYIFYYASCKNRYINVDNRYQNRF
jgi:hypothetical protein